MRRRHCDKYFTSFSNFCLRTNPWNKYVDSMFRNRNKTKKSRETLCASSHSKWVKEKDWTQISEFRASILYTSLSCFLRAVYLPCNPEPSLPQASVPLCTVCLHIPSLPPWFLVRLRWRHEWETIPKQEIVIEIYKVILGKCKFISQTWIVWMCFGDMDGFFSHFLNWSLLCESAYVRQKVPYWQ